MPGGATAARLETLLGSIFLLVIFPMWLMQSRQLSPPPSRASHRLEQLHNLHPRQQPELRAGSHTPAAPFARETSPLCGVGDLHGDLAHAMHALRLCGAVDAGGAWVGGNMTVVQTGDVVDRGNASIPTLEWLWQLRPQAEAAGGELKLLVGNHELLNMQGRLFYVHGYSRSGRHGGELMSVGGIERWRARLDPRSGDLGSRLVQQDGVSVRGDGACRTLFVHAGVRLRYAQHYGSIEALNAALREQILHNVGELLDAHEGPLWWRGYARPRATGMPEADVCKEIAATLDFFGARQMAVGHNIVPWVSSRCDGLLQMIDVGMSSAYGGRPAAWRCDEVTGSVRIRALYSDGEAEEPPPICSRCARADPRTRDWSDCREYCA